MSTEPKLYLNAWNAQRIVYELVINHLITNDPKDLGYSFTQRYNHTEPRQSGIYVSNAFQWNATKINARPAIFISRQDVLYGNRQFIGQNYSENAMTGQQLRFRTCTLPIKVSVIAGDLGLTEDLADYLKKMFLYQALEIKRDFCLRDFSLKMTSAPRQFPEARDNFQVDLLLNIVYDENWSVTKETLKLKSVSYHIFENVTKPSPTPTALPPGLWNPDTQAFYPSLPDAQEQSLPAGMQPPPLFAGNPNGVRLLNPDDGKYYILSVRGNEWPYHLHIAPACET